jgi:hypothetical protein
MLFQNYHHTLHSSRANFITCIQIHNHSLFGMTLNATKGQRLRNKQFPSLGTVSADSPSIDPPLRIKNHDFTEMCTLSTTDNYFRQRLKLQCRLKHRCVSVHSGALSVTANNGNFYIRAEQRMNFRS